MGDILYREPNKVLWRGVRPAHNGDQIVKDGAATNIVQIIHTVTASKVFYFKGYSFEANSSAAGVWGKLEVRDVLDADQYTIQWGYFDAAGQMIDSNDFSQPLEIPEGYDIYLESNALTVDVRAFIHGWEE